MRDQRLVRLRAQGTGLERLLDLTYCFPRTLRAPGQDIGGHLTGISLADGSAGAVQLGPVAVAA